jgi:voltage-gated potassium channel
MRDRFNDFVQRHEIAWELSMGLLAILYVATGFAVPEAGATPTLLVTLEVALTAIFIAEFTVRVGTSRDRRAYLRSHWIDLLALVPVARGLRVARLLRVLRLTRFFAGTYRAVVRAERMRGAEGIALVVVGWTAVMAICCTAFYAMETGENPAMQSPIDAAWWGVTTLTTVGYGDVVPWTPEGRLIAAALMVLGIGLFGAITAITTNTLLSRTSEGAPRDAIAELERLARLWQDGALTAQEFDRAKQGALLHLEAST